VEKEKNEKLVDFGEREKIKMQMVEEGRKNIYEITLVYSSGEIITF
jgi:hypothetical protein